MSILGFNILTIDTKQCNVMNQINSMNGSIV